jgi:hypothetical protein
MGRTLLGTLGMLALAASTCTMQLTVMAVEQIGKGNMSPGVLATSVGVNGVITIGTAVVAFRCFSAATAKARNGQSESGSWTRDSSTTPNKLTA